MSAKNEKNKMAKMNAKNEEDKMVAEPRARYNLRSRSQSWKVESKEVKLPRLRKPKDKLIGHQRKDKSPKNNGNKFPNTYLEDKGTVWGPFQMAKKKEFEKDEEFLLLSLNRGSHFDGRYIGPYRREDISNRYPRVKEEDTSVSYKQTKKYVRREGQPVLAVATESRTTERKDAPAVETPPLKLKNSEILKKFEEKLGHLSASEREDVEKLMKKYPGLFSDVPRKCSDR